MRTTPQADRTAQKPSIPDAEHPPWHALPIYAKDTAAKQTAHAANPDARSSEAGT